MSLLGQAALAMWWDMSAEMDAEFEDWHSHEHFRERLAIPGFRRATRWRSADGGEGVFQIYELADHGVLSSPPYLARLNAPSPWSVRMMPHHRNMVRSQCRVLVSHGGHGARHALVIRLSPASGRDHALRQALEALFLNLIERRGLIGAHLLRHDPPALAQTTEQKIRGSDRFADWVLIVAGYDLACLQALGHAELGAAALEQLGAAPGAVGGCYTLSVTAVAGELPPSPAPA